MRQLEGRALVAMAALLVSAGCGSGGGSTPGQPSAAQIQVGGQYDVAVALASNACGSVTVQAQPTTVAHTAGATRFTLTHGANAFGGTLSSDGTFVTDALTLTDADGSRLSVVLQGRFTTTGLQATVTVDVSARPGGAADCRYVVQWTGNKLGSPNVLP